MKLSRAQEEKVIYEKISLAMLCMVILLFSYIISQETHIVAVDKAWWILIPNDPYHPLIQISRSIGSIFHPIIIAIVTLCTSVYLFKKSHVQYAVFLALSTISLGLLVVILKLFLPLSRPLVSMSFEYGYSFPSAHAAFAFLPFMLYTIAVRIHGHHNERLVGIIENILFITFLIIATTRIILGVHTFLDIMGGIFICASVTLLSALVLTKKKNKKTK